MKQNMIKEPVYKVLYCVFLPGLSPDGFRHDREVLKKTRSVNNSAANIQLHQWNWSVPVWTTFKTDLYILPAFNCIVLSWKDQESLKKKKKKKDQESLQNNALSRGDLPLETDIENIYSVTEI